MVPAFEQQICSELPSSQDIIIIPVVIIIINDNDNFYYMTKERI